jgi:hypothetical protein
MSDSDGGSIRFCSQCGQQGTSSDRFCSRCGADQSASSRSEGQPTGKIDTPDSQNTPPAGTPKVSSEQGAPIIRPSSSAGRNRPVGLILAIVAAAILLVGGGVGAAIALTDHGSNKPVALKPARVSTTVPSTLPPESTTTTTIAPTTTAPSVPVSSGFNYQAAVQKVQSLGYSIYEDESGDQSVGPLNVLTATCTGSATGYCQNAFFFVNNSYIGTDTSSPDIGVSIASWQNGTTVALNYPLYEPSDANCCPTGGTRTVRFNWNGSRLLPLDPLPNNPNNVA